MRAILLREQLRVIHGDSCPGCGVSFDVELPTIDHKTPLARGGGNGIYNLWLLCAACNLEKSNLTVDEWRDWRRNKGPRCCIHRRRRHVSYGWHGWGRCLAPGCDCECYRRPRLEPPLSVQQKLERT